LKKFPDLKKIQRKTTNKKTRPGKKMFSKYPLFPRNMSNNAQKKNLSISSKDIVPVPQCTIHNKFEKKNIAIEN